MKLAEQAVQKVPNDPVIHEFGALCLFALGEYQKSAVVLNALLAVAPGMDWTTLISLYSSSDEYTAQLRELEAHVKKNPTDSAAIFVLAYHYLVCGHADSALNALQRVVAAQPNDQVAKRMYDALKGPDQAPAPPAAEAQPPAAKPAVEPKPEPAKADEAAPTTDLVGQWHAERDGNAFDLTIDEQGRIHLEGHAQGQGADDDLRPVYGDRQRAGHGERRSRHDGRACHVRRSGSIPVRHRRRPARRHRADIQTGENELTDKRPILQG